ncbi:uncharacterized protein LOC141825167 [Curcuma longa]|uniref:uncharacterized protein LOC141825167 n=1 Tax=Curcuma longa TaxID=136217 RepID=UPI003D9F48AD
MAKQSDFTQKLLKDLRLRKEKLGYSTSPGQKSTHVPPTEYQGNSFRPTDQRTREAMINYSSRNSISAEAKEIWLTNKHNKAAVSELTSSDIVPVGRNKKIQNCIDVSMALALVLSNSGKLHYIAKLGNEFITHSGPILYREHLLNNMKIHASHYPFLSNLQVNEISEGVHKLNRVLETCSDRDSINIGRELLKGAMDLEESLKMLVTLQEASDFMVGSQGRQIRLLKDKGEDESSRNKVNRKNTQYSKTRISFDGSTDHFFRANYDTLNQGKSELSPSFIRKGMNTTDYDESSSHASMKIPEHRRSLSSSPVFPSSAQYSSNGCNDDHNNKRQSSSTSKDKHSTSNHIQKLDRKQASGNVRMPSVVAKLMGLEEFPSSKAEAKKVGGKDLACTKQIIIADAEARRKVVSQTLSMPSYEGNKCLGEKLIGDTKAKIHKEIQSTSTSKGYAPKSHSPKAAVAKNSVQPKEKVGKTEQRSKKIDQDMSPKLEKDLEKSKQKMLSWNHYEIFGKKDKVLKQKITEEDQSSLASSKIKTQQSHQLIAHMVKAKHAVSENEGKEHESNSNVKVATATKDERRSKRSAVKLSKLKVDDATSAEKVRHEGYEEDAKQPKEHLESSNQEMQNIVNRVSDYRESNKTRTHENSDNMNSLQNNPATERVKSLPTAKKVDAANMKAYRDKSHRVLGDNFADVERQSKKIQSSFLNDLEKRWKERTSKNQVQTVSLHETYTKQHHKQESPSNLLSVDSPVDTGGDKNILQDILVEEQHVNDMIKEDSVASQNQKVSLSLDTEPRLSNLEEEEKQGATENKHSNCNHSKWQKQEICEANGQGLLTKDENLLKQLLVNNQQFLDMAQALLNITIPGVVLQTRNKACQKEENKVLLDCGYELLRRKGKIENVRAMEPLYSPGDVNIDALVKELNNDFESLKFSNESTVSDDDAEFLYMLLERDIENREPDINCMWDIGWSSIVAASLQKDEFTRDLEKHVLSGLISELARELIHQYNHNG